MTIEGWDVAWGGWVLGDLADVLRRAADLLGRVAMMWEILLPAVVSDESLSYFREFLAREAMRHASGSTIE